MRQIRTVAAATAAAAALTAGVGGAAQAATLTIDHACYYSFGSAHQPIRVAGAGFTPNATVNLTLAGAPYHTTASSTGGFRGTIPAPAIGGGRARVTLSASDGQASAGVRFYLTKVTSDFNPSAGPPGRLRVRFKVTGLGAVLAFLRRDPHARVFAHWIRPGGGVRGTRAFGRLHGPCGDLTTPRTRLLPFPSELGTWKVFLDANRAYRRRETAQLAVGFTVRRI